MAIAAVGDLVKALRQSRLLGPHQVEEVVALQAHFHDPRELARHLLKRGWLTAYQLNQIFQGNAQELVLGQYQLLERLGEGGMGQVFKARHQRLDRLVALKIIRKEKLDNPQAVRRFQRETQAAAQLSHPNIVMAFDADQVGATHFFAMEYVEGIDLSKLVKDSGPLPLAQACDYVRQAALGLQHAFERGLVHRDIKPANLLLSQSQSPHGQGGVVKILDMGLARLDNGDSDTVSRLTQEGTVMGTPDYIAPEQALNSSSADIRADIYSLGCTLYFLLTGQVLFPGGTMMEKLLKHRSEPPASLEKLRRDVPPQVSAIVQKMLEKKPEDRYQTPAEVAEALAAVRSGARFQAQKVVRADKDNAATLVNQESSPIPRRPRRWRRYAAIAAGMVFLGMLVSLGKKSPPKDKPGPVVESPLSLLDRIPAGQFVRREWQPPELVAVLGSEQKQPQLCVALSKDGRWLASGADDNRVHLWDLASLAETPLTKQAGAVNAVAFHPDNQLLASACQDDNLRTWNLDAPRLASIWKAHGYGVDALAFSRDGALLATAGGDHKIKLWDSHGKPLGSLESNQAIYALAFAPDGTILAGAGKDGIVRLWDTKTCRETTRLSEPHPDQVQALAFSPNGKVLASAGRDKTVRLWSLETSEVVKLEGHAEEVKGLAFAPDGRRLASVGDDGRLIVWDMASKRPEYNWAMPYPMRGVAFAPDSRHLATANQNGSVTIFRVQTR